MIWVGSAACKTEKLLTAACLVCLSFGCGAPQPSNARLSEGEVKFGLTEAQRIALVQNVVDCQARVKRKIEQKHRGDPFKFAVIQGSEHGCIEGVSDKYHVKKDEYEQIVSEAIRKHWPHGHLK